MVLFKGLRLFLAQNGIGVRLVNDEYTSQLYSCCHKLFGSLFDEKVQIILGKKCENRACLVTFIYWDKNALRNVEYVFKRAFLMEDQ